MPRASKQSLDKLVWKQINSTLVEVLLSFKKTDLEKFLSEFLTKEEKTMLTKRLTLYTMLLGGYTDIEIKNVLKVSYEIIRTTRNFLVFKSRRFKESLEKWSRRPKRTRRSNRLIKMIELALAAKSDRRVRAKLASGDY